MTKTQITEVIEQAQYLYTKVYSQAHTQLHADGNEHFTGCGWTWAWFAGKGNAGLKPALTSLGYTVRNEYGGGLRFEFRNIKLDKYGTNGDIALREEANGAAVKVLREAGFKVYSKSRLD